ncbi:MAG: carotenoid biosynthesis protein [Bauldia sp.]|nr:carotenoid biosynthesis protein [Bauldia sp.]
MFALAGLLAVPLLLGVPFVLRDTIVWQQMNVLLLVGTVSFVLAVLLHASASFSPASALLFLVLGVGVGLAAELSALRWGLPLFGDYSYNPALRPQLMGLPLFIPLAWFVLAYLPLVLLRRLAVGGRHKLLRRLTKTLLCSLYLTAVDLALDPLAISIGAWTWSESGGYLGVPASNFVGWFLVGIVIYGVFFAVEPDRTEAPAPALDALIVGLIGALGLLALLAVGAHVRHWLPIVLSVAVLAPYFGYWYRTRDRSSS